MRRLIVRAWHPCVLCVGAVCGRWVCRLAPAACCAWVRCVGAGCAGLHRLRVCAEDSGGDRRCVSHRYSLDGTVAPMPKFSQVGCGEARGSDGWGGGGGGVTSALARLLARVPAPHSQHPGCAQRAAVPPPSRGAAVLGAPRASCDAHCQAPEPAWGSVPLGQAPPRAHSALCVIACVVLC